MEDGNPSEMVVHIYQTVRRQSYDILILYLAYSCVSFRLTTSRYQSPPDRSFGTDQGNGSWNGMIGMIVRDEVRLSIAGLIWDTAGALVVDFIKPMEQIK